MHGQRLQLTVLLLDACCTELIQWEGALRGKLTKGDLRVYNPLFKSAAPIIFFEETSCIKHVELSNNNWQWSVVVSLGTDIRLKEKSGI
jgi:hypothetical protein